MLALDASGPAGDFTREFIRRQVAFIGCGNRLESLHIFRIGVMPLRQRYQDTKGDPHRIFVGFHLTNITRFFLVYNRTLVGVSSGVAVSLNSRNH